MNEQEVLSRLALSFVPGIGLTTAHKLCETIGSAREVFEQRNELIHLFPNGGQKLATALDCPEAFERARRELDFADRHQIECLAPDDSRYPTRLHDCPDAPLLLFYKGSAALNCRHVVNLVGTRHATDYGVSLCRTFMAGLKALCPDVLVVSGLAYGIDIAAHRSALDQGLLTVGVLGHGLDRIYPAIHRDTAARMVEHGGLLTEFPSGTQPERYNFVCRNRIIAGVSDATIVVESASKGGALITAHIASDYQRDCFAFPGPVGAPYSVGCNNLIRLNGATLLQSAEELVEAMRWASASRPPAQPELFPDELTDEERLIAAQLQRHREGMQINTLAVQTNLPVNRLSALLFELELKGMVTPLAGGTYRLN